MILLDLEITNAKLKGDLYKAMTKYYNQQNAATSDDHANSIVIVTDEGEITVPLVRKL